jgi:hypothetical protein
MELPDQLAEDLPQQHRIAADAKVANQSLRNRTLVVYDV